MIPTAQFLCYWKGDDSWAFLQLASLSAIHQLQIWPTMVLVVPMCYLCSHSSFTYSLKILSLLTSSILNSHLAVVMYRRDYSALWQHCWVCSRIQKTTFLTTPHHIYQWCWVWSSVPQTFKLSTREGRETLLLSLVFSYSLNRIWFQLNMKWNMKCWMEMKT